MKRIAAIVTIALASLTATAAAEAQSDRSTRDMWSSYAQRLNIGSTVRIRTTAGDECTGVLMLVDNEAITVKPRTRYPEPSRRILFDAIDDLQLRTPHPGSAGKSVAIGAAIGGAVFLTLLLALAGG
jgi:hypothetical protein